MTRRMLPRLILSAATVAALVAALTMFAGSGFARGSVADANYAPQNTTAPAISGTAQIDQTLTASTGQWNSQTTPTFAYQWQRCDAAGNGCASISGATAQTYKVQSADQGKTLRVVVTATNPSGSAAATSAQTAVVGQAGPDGATKLSNGMTSIPATSVGLPALLVIDGVKFSPSPIRTRGPVTARFHVSDTRGFVVRDALVLAQGLPYGWARSGGEVQTDQSGWATVTLRPTINLPLRRGSLVVFVRARVSGQPLLSGSSARRLVQVRIR